MFVMARVGFAAFEMLITLNDSLSVSFANLQVKNPLKTNFVVPAKNSIKSWLGCSGELVESDLIC